MKKWYVFCELNLSSSMMTGVTVKAFSRKRAIHKALNKLYDKGYFCVKVISCEEI